MNWDRPGYLLYQTEHGKPLTAGYISRDDPRAYPGRLPVVSDFRYLGPDINAVDVRAYAPTVFDFLDVRWVVVDRYQMPEGAQRQATENLVGTIFAGRPPLYEDERITVYETWPETPLPFIELGPDWGPRQPGPDAPGVGQGRHHHPQPRYHAHFATRRASRRRRTGRFLAGRRRGSEDRTRDRARPQPGLSPSSLAPTVSCYEASSRAWSSAVSAWSRPDGR